MKAMGILRSLGALTLLGASLALTGCKPDLAAANAQAMVQAKYDQDAPQSVTILLNDAAMRQGATANYWTMVKKYPNPLWADFKLTDAGKKLLKSTQGGDGIEWRPAVINDAKYTVAVMTVATSRPKAKDFKDVQDEVGGDKSVVFNETTNLDGLPDALQQIAHNPGNKLSVKRQATFSVDGGVWKLASIH